MKTMGDREFQSIPLSINYPTYPMASQSIHASLLNHKNDFFLILSLCMSYRKIPEIFVRIPEITSPSNK